jgi:hypothetical protein
LWYFHVYMYCNVRVAFCCWVIGFLHMFWILIPYICNLQIFSQFSELPFLLYRLYPLMHKRFFVLMSHLCIFKKLLMPWHHFKNEKKKLKKCHEEF